MYMIQCGCHVLLAEFALRWIWQAFMCSHLCTYSHRYSISVQAVTHSHKKIERSLSIFPIALCYTPVAAMCFLPNFAPWRIWQAFMCSHLCTYSHQIFFFRTDGDAFSQKIERSVSIFFSDSFVVYSCSCHVLLAEAPLSELILRFVISCYISHDVSLCVPYC